MILHTCREGTSVITSCDARLACVAGGISRASVVLVEKPWTRVAKPWEVGGYKSRWNEQLKSLYHVLATIDVFYCHFSAHHILHWPIYINGAPQILSPVLTTTSYRSHWNIHNIQSFLMKLVKNFSNSIQQPCKLIGEKKVLQMKKRVKLPQD